MIPTDGNATNPARRGAAPAPGGWTYWTLLAMGFAAFAPAILLPEWRAYQNLLIREQWERTRLNQWQRALEREQRLIEGLREDPAVIARVARRELSFRRADERAVPVQPAAARAGVPLTGRSGTVLSPPAIPQDLPEDNPAEELDSADAAARAVIPEWPTGLEPVIRALPSLPYDFLFCDPQVRVLMMGLGLCTIAAAVWLFGRKPAHAPGW